MLDMKGVTSAVEGALYGTGKDGNLACANALSTECSGSVAARLPKMLRVISLMINDVAGVAAFSSLYIFDASPEPSGVHSTEIGEERLFCVDRKDARAA